MAKDRLISSQSEDFRDPSDNKRAIRVWVKRYASGRTRIVIDPANYMEVVSVINGGNTDDIKIELEPA